MKVTEKSSPTASSSSTARRRPSRLTAGTLKEAAGGFRHADACVPHRAIHRGAGERTSWASLIWDRHRRVSNAIEVLVPRGARTAATFVPAFPPKATPTVKFERGKKFTFTLNVTVKPTYELTSYEPAEITVPPSLPSTTPINQQLEEIAKNSVTHVVA
ncbi:MAG: trigger factor [Adlercreutzia equolifaciens]